MATETQDAPPQDPHFLQRVGSLPIVTTAIDQLSTIYEHTKERNRYLKYTLETAEAGVKTIATSTMPVVSKLEKPIGAIDSAACNQLDKLEGKYPIITRPTDEIVEETKKVYDESLKPHVDRVTGVTQSTMDKVGAAKQYTVDTVSATKQYTVDTVTSVKDYGVNKASDIKNYTYEKVAATAAYGKEKLDSALDTPSGKAVIAKVDQLLDKTEQYVDYYLPEEEKEKEKEKGSEGKPDEGEAEKESEKDTDESLVPAEGQVQSGEGAKPSEVTFGKLVNMSDKVRRRMYAKSLRELQHVQRRSKETLERLNFTVDLIEYARSNIDGAKNKASHAKEKFLNIWEEINKEEEEIEMSNLNEDGEKIDEGEKEKETTQVSDATLEKRAIATARHLTSQLKRGFHTMMSTASLLPTGLQTRVSDARTFTENLYFSFSNAKKLEDIPSTMIGQTREKVSYLQETIASYTDYLRTTYFGSYFKGSGSVEGDNVDTVPSPEEEEEEEEEEKEKETEKTDESVEHFVEAKEPPVESGTPVDREVTEEKTREEN